MTVDNFVNRSPQPNRLRNSHSRSSAYGDAKGDWTRAHESAQQDEGPEGSWVHAYLHRKKAIRATQSIGMVGRGSLCADNQSMRNGSAS